MMYWAADLSSLKEVLSVLLVVLKQVTKMAFTIFFVVHSNGYHLITVNGITGIIIDHFENSNRQNLVDNSK